MVHVGVSGGTINAMNAKKEWGHLYEKHSHSYARCTKDMALAFKAFH